MRASVDTDTDLLPWYQQCSESAKAYDAFSAYLALGPSRSLAKTSQNYTKTIPNLKIWSGKHRWVERAAAYDSHQAGEARKAAEAAHAAKITAYRERSAKVGAAMADIGLGFLVAAGKRLKSLDVETIPITSLPNFLRAAADITQKSLSVEAEALGVHALEELMDSNEEDSGAAAD